MLVKLAVQRDQDRGRAASPGAKVAQFLGPGVGLAQGPDQDLGPGLALG